jgi:exocyst complex component 8
MENSPRKLLDRTNIIKLRHGREGHVFRTDRASEKKSLLASFRQTSEELATKKRKEREGEHERRMSVWTLGDRVSMGDFSNLPPMPEWAAEAGRMPVGMKEKGESDARWISEFSDSLTVAIALHEWEEAVKLVEEGM